MTPQGKVRFGGRTFPAKTWNCKLLVPYGEFKESNSAHCQITLAVVAVVTLTAGQKSHPTYRKTRSKNFKNSPFGIQQPQINYRKNGQLNKNQK